MAQHIIYEDRGEYEHGLHQEFLHVIHGDQCSGGGRDNDDGKHVLGLSGLHLGIYRRG